MRKGSLAVALALCVPALALFLFFFVTPLVNTANTAFLAFDPQKGIVNNYSLGNFVEILTDGYYYELFFRTILLALVTTFFCAVIGMYEAYIIHRMRNPWKSIFFMIILAPLLISVVVRTLGWAVLLGNAGIMNQFMMGMGLISEPVRILQTPGAIVIGLIHVLLPFMVIPIWAALQKQDPMLQAAARSLGADRQRAFRRIVAPLTMPGLLSGSIIVFSLSASAFATPAILGGRRLKVMSTSIYDEFMGTLNWPLGSAVAALLLLFTMATLVIYNRLVERRYRRWMA